MSYEARGNGVISLNRPVAEIPEAIFTNASTAFTEIADTPDNGLWITYEYGRYHEDEILDFLVKMAPYTASGKIEFIGEDDAIWRFVWDRGKWQEQSGRIVYEPANRNERHGERLEMLGCMADIVEDWLESKGITADDIPCEDRDHAIEDGDDGCAIIYGTDYGHLTGEFEELLINCGLIEKGNFEMFTMEKTNPFPALFDDAEQGGYPKSEMGYLRAYYRDEKWNSVYFPTGEHNESLANEFNQIYRQFTERNPKLSIMRYHCKQDAMQIENWCGNEQYVAFMETPIALYRFVMRFTPGDYNLYLHCYDKWRIPMTDRQKIIDRVVENYECGEADLTAMCFDFNVSLPKSDLFDIYREIQQKINGDEVFFPDNLDEKYTGLFQDLLESCNDKAGYVRISEGELNCFVF